MSDIIVAGVSVSRFDCTSSGSSGGGGGDSMLQEITRATLCRRGSGGCMHFHCKSLLPRPGRGSVLSAPSHSFPLPALPFHGKENVGYFCPFGIAIDSYRRHPCFLPSLMSASALAFRHRHYYSRISSSPNRGIEIQDH